MIAKERELLAQDTAGKGFRPQSPRDINDIAGSNIRIFNAAPASTNMNFATSTSIRIQSIKLMTFQSMQAMALLI